MILAALLLLAADVPPLDGIAHVALRVTDVPASRAYYQKLGFEQAFEFSDAKGITTSYMKINDRQFIELYRRNAPTEPLGLMHLCLDTSGLEALNDAYVARGLQPTDKRKARAGNLLFNLRDPEGHLIEYTQYLPGSMHSNDRGQHLSAARISTHLLRAATAARDQAALAAWFQEKLAFASRFGEAVEVDAASPAWKPRLVFEVPDTKAATAELKKRGLAAADPDGTLIVFRER